MRAIRRITLYTILVALALVFLAPSFGLVISSLKTQSEFRTSPRILPAELQWENYDLVFRLAPFWRYARNSVVIAIISIVLNTFSSSLVAFGFARLRAPGKTVLFMLVVSMLLMPSTAMVIPQFILYTRLRLVNTYWPWALAGAAGSAWHIFLFRQFFLTMPKDLEDAAEVDGCGWFRIFWQIFLPNSLPVVATSCIFQFAWAWSDYVWPSLYLSMDSMNLAGAVGGAFVWVDPTGASLEMVRMAAALLYLAPMLIIFFLGQKYIVENVVTTGIKG